MVSLATLKYLATQKAKDAEILFRNRRNSGAIYLMGYALEFSLKRKISLTLGFDRGFPEAPSELNSYSSQIANFHSLSTGIQLTQMRQIRNHKLSELLTYSGAEGRIISSYYPQWILVKNWDPEKRYVRQRITLRKATAFIQATKQILREIS
jgi:hypothetical protein